MTKYKCGSAKSCKYGDMCKPNFNIGACSHYKAEEPQTNEKWIHTLNTEQLAEWIAKIVDCDCCPIKRKFCDDNPCKIRFAKWLKQPHREVTENEIM